MNLATRKYQGSYGQKRWSLFHHEEVICKQKQIIVEKDFLGFFINLNLDITYELTGIGKGVLSSMHFALVRVPQGMGSITLHDGWNDFFYLTVDFATLMSVMKEFPLTGNFMESVQKSDNVVSLTGHPLLVTHEIASTLCQMVDDDSWDLRLRQIIRSLKGPELLILCLKRLHDELFYHRKRIQGAA